MILYTAPGGLELTVREDYPGTHKETSALILEFWG